LAGGATAPLGLACAGVSRTVVALRPRPANPLGVRGSGASPEPRVGPHLAAATPARTRPGPRTGAPLGATAAPTITPGAGPGLGATRRAAGAASLRLTRLIAVQAHTGQHTGGPHLLLLTRKRARATAAARALQEISRRRPTLPGGCPPSTIGAGGLNFRVRDGNGCGPTAMVTGNLALYSTSSPDRAAAL
jgi:hypothetical protein